MPTWQNMTRSDTESGSSPPVSLRSTLSPVRGSSAKTDSVSIGNYTNSANVSTSQADMMYVSSRSRSRSRSCSLSLYSLYLPCVYCILTFSPTLPRPFLFSPLAAWFRANHCFQMLRSQAKPPLSEDRDDAAPTYSDFLQGTPSERADAAAASCERSTSVGVHTPASTLRRLHLDKWQNFVNPHWLTLIHCLEMDSVISHTDALVLSYLLLKQPSSFGEIFDSFRSSNRGDVRALVKSLARQVRAWRSVSFESAKLESLRRAASTDRSVRLSTLHVYQAFFLVLNDDSDMIPLFSQLHRDDNVAGFAASVRVVVTLRQEQARVPEHLSAAEAVQHFTPNHFSNPLVASTLTSESVLEIPPPPVHEHLHLDDTLENSLASILARLREYGLINRSEHVLLFHLANTSHPVMLAAWSLYTDALRCARLMGETNNNAAATKITLQPGVIHSSSSVPTGSYRSHRQKSDDNWQAQCDNDDCSSDDNDPSVSDERSASGDSSEHVSLSSRSRLRQRSATRGNQPQSRRYSELERHRSMFQRAGSAAMAPAKIGDRQIDIPVEDQLRLAWNEFWTTSMRLIRTLDPSVLLFSRLLSGLLNDGVISTADMASLTDLHISGDEEILTLLEQYQNGDVSNDPIEFVAQLQILARRWRNARISPDADMCVQEALDLFQYLTESGTISQEENDTLCSSMYDRDEHVVSACLMYSTNEDWVKFSTAILECVHAAPDALVSKYCRQAADALYVLVESGQLSTAESDCLARRIVEKDVVVIAVMAEFELNGAMFEMFDSLAHIAGSWRRELFWPAEILELPQTLVACGLLSVACADAFEQCLYTNNTVLCEAVITYYADLEHTWQHKMLNTTPHCSNSSSSNNNNNNNNKNNNNNNNNNNSSERCISHGRDNCRRPWVHFWRALCEILCPLGFDLVHHLQHWSNVLDYYQEIGVLEPADAMYIRYGLTCENHFLLHLFERECDGGHDSEERLGVQLADFALRWRTAPGVDDILFNTHDAMMTVLDLMKQHQIADGQEPVDPVTDASVLLSSELSVLETLLMLRDPTLMAAYDAYEDMSSISTTVVLDTSLSCTAPVVAASVEFIDSLHRILDRELNATCQKSEHVARGIVRFLRSSMHLPTADYLHLLQLAADGDPIMYAAVDVAIECSLRTDQSRTIHIDQSNSSWAECFDTVMRLTDTWRQQLSDTQTDLVDLIESLHYCDSRKPKLLAIEEEYRDHYALSDDEQSVSDCATDQETSDDVGGIVADDNTNDLFLLSEEQLQAFSSIDVDTLVALVLLESTPLRAAYSVWLESSKLNDDWLEFCETLQLILRREHAIELDRLANDIESTLTTAYSNGALSRMDCAFLLAAAQQHNDVLLAAYAQYELSRDFGDFVDCATRICCHQREHATCAALLCALHDLELVPWRMQPPHQWNIATHIDPAALEILEVFILKEDPVIVGIWQTFEHQSLNNTSDIGKYWVDACNELAEVVRQYLPAHIMPTLDHYVRTTMHRLATTGRLTLSEYIHCSRAAQAKVPAIEAAISRLRMSYDADGFERQVTAFAQSWRFAPRVSESLIETLYLLHEQGDLSLAEFNFADFLVYISCDELVSVAATARCQPRQEKLQSLRSSIMSLVHQWHNLVVSGCITWVQGKLPAIRRALSICNPDMNHLNRYAQLPVSAVAAVEQLHSNPLVAAVLEFVKARNSTRVDISHGNMFMHDILSVANTLHMDGQYLTQDNRDVVSFSVVRTLLQDRLASSLQQCSQSLLQMIDICLNNPTESNDQFATCPEMQLLNAVQDISTSWRLQASQPAQMCLSLCSDMYAAGLVSDSELARMESAIFADYDPLLQSLLQCFSDISQMPRDAADSIVRRMSMCSIELGSTIRHLEHQNVENVLAFGVQYVQNIVAARSNEPSMNERQNMHPAQLQAISFSSTGLLFLQECLDFELTRSDTVSELLLQALLEYNDTGDYVRVFHDLLGLSQLWLDEVSEITDEDRRFMFLCYELFGSNQLSSGDLDMIEQLVFTQFPVLLAAIVEFDAVFYRETGTADVVVFEVVRDNPTIVNVAWSELWDTIARILPCNHNPLPVLLLPPHSTYEYSEAGAQRTSTIVCTQRDHIATAIENVHEQGGIGAADVQCIMNILDSNDHTVMDNHATLQACFYQYLVNQNVELFEMQLATIASHWRTTGDDIHIGLVSYVAALEEMQVVSLAELDILELCILNRDPQFRAAFTDAAELRLSVSQQHRQHMIDDATAEEMEQAASAALWGAVMRTIDISHRRTCAKLMPTFMKILQNWSQFQSMESPQYISPAGFEYLFECLNHGDATLFAALQDSESVDELHEIAAHVSRRWVHALPSWLAPLLPCIDECVANGFLDMDDRRIIESLLLERDETLIAAFMEFVQDGEQSWNAFYQCILYLCQQKRENDAQVADEFQRTRYQHCRTALLEQRAGLISAADIRHFDLMHAHRDPVLIQAVTVSLPFVAAALKHSYSQSDSKPLSAITQHVSIVDDAMLGHLYSCAVSWRDALQTADSKWDIHTLEIVQLLAVLLDMSLFDRDIWSVLEFLAYTKYPPLYAAYALLQTCGDYDPFEPQFCSGWSEFWDTMVHIVRCYVKDVPENSEVFLSHAELLSGIVETIELPLSEASTRRKYLGDLIRVGDRIMQMEFAAYISGELAPQGLIDALQYRSSNWITMANPNDIISHIRLMLQAGLIVPTECDYLCSLAYNKDPQLIEVHWAECVMKQPITLESTAGHSRRQSYVGARGRNVEHDVSQRNAFCTEAFRILERELDIEQADLRGTALEVIQTLYLTGDLDMASFDWCLEQARAGHNAIMAELSITPASDTDHGQLVAHVLVQDAEIVDTFQRVGATWPRYHTASRGAIFALHELERMAAVHRLSPFRVSIARLVIYRAGMSDHHDKCAFPELAALLDEPHESNPMWIESLYNQLTRDIDSTSSYVLQTARQLGYMLVAALHTHIEQRRSVDHERLRGNDNSAELQDALPFTASHRAVTATDIFNSINISAAPVDDTPQAANIHDHVDVSESGWSSADSDVSEDGDDVDQEVAGVFSDGFGANRSGSGHDYAYGDGDGDGDDEHDDIWTLGDGEYVFGAPNIVASRESSAHQSNHRPRRSSSAAPAGVSHLPPLSDADIAAADNEQQLSMMLMNAHSNTMHSDDVHHTVHGGRSSRSGSAVDLHASKWSARSADATSQGACSTAQERLGYAAALIQQYTPHIDAIPTTEDTMTEPDSFHLGAAASDSLTTGSATSPPSRRVRGHTHSWSLTHAPSGEIRIPDIEALQRLDHQSMLGSPTISTSARAHGTRLTDTVAIEAAMNLFGSSQNATSSLPSLIGDSPRSDSSSTAHTPLRLASPAPLRHQFSFELPPAVPLPDPAELLLSSSPSLSDGSAPASRHTTTTADGAHHLQSHVLRQTQTAGFSADTNVSKHGWVLQHLQSSAQHAAVSAALVADIPNVEQLCDLQLADLQHLSDCLADDESELLLLLVRYVPQEHLWNTTTSDPTSSSIESALCELLVTARSHAHPLAAAATAAVQELHDIAIAWRSSSSLAPHAHGHERLVAHHNRDGLHERLLERVHALHDEDRFNGSVVEALELLIYWDDPALLCAYDVYCEAETCAGHDTAGLRSAWREMCDTFVRVLHAHGFNDWHIDAQPDLITPSSLLVQHIEYLHILRNLSSSERSYLMSLVRQRDGDPVLEAALMEFSETHDEAEFHDTLVRIGSRWRQHSPYRELLSLLLALLYEKPSAMVYSQWNLLDEKVFFVNDAVLQPWRKYEAALAMAAESNCAIDESVLQSAVAELHDNMVRILDNTFSTEVDALMMTGTTAIDYMWQHRLVYGLSLADRTFLLQSLHVAADHLPVLASSNSNSNFNRATADNHCDRDRNSSALRRAAREQASSTLIAALSLFRDDRNIGELVDTVLRVSRLWRVRATVREQHMLHTLENLVLSGYICRGDSQQLEQMVYDGQLSFSPDEVLPQVLEKLRTCLGSFWSAEWDRLLVIAESIIESFVGSDALSRASTVYLKHLVSCSYSTSVEYCPDAVLLALLYEYESSTVDHETLRQSMLRLSTRWQRECCEESQKLLQLLCVLNNDQLISAAEYEHMMYLVFVEDDVLCSAFSVYSDSQESRIAWHEFWDTLSHVLLHHASAIESISHSVSKGGAASPLRRGDRTVSNTDGTIPRRATQVTVLHQFIDHLHSLNDHRVLCKCDTRFLKTLLVAGDVCLDVAWQIYRDTGDMAEFVDSLFHIARQWRRVQSSVPIRTYIGIDADNELEPIKTVGELLAELDDLLLDVRWITFHEWDYLCGLVLDRSVPLCMGFCETSNRLEFMKRVVHPLLDQWVEVHQADRSATGYALVESVALRFRYELPLATVSYLRQLLRASDPALHAALSLYCSDDGTGSDGTHEAVRRAEVLDTLRRIGSRWQRLVSSKDQLLLKYCRELCASPDLRFGRSEFNAVKSLIFHRDPALIGAFNTLVEHQFARPAWQWFFAMLGHRIDELFSMHSARLQERATTIVVVLEQSEQLNEADMISLQRLCANGDHVLLATVEEFIITNDFDEMLDTVGRLAMRWRKPKLIEDMLSLVSSLCSRHALPEALASTLETTLVCAPSQLLPALRAYKANSAAEHAWRHMWKAIVDVCSAAMRDADQDAKSGRSRASSDADTTIVASETATEAAARTSSSTNSSGSGGSNSKHRTIFSPLSQAIFDEAIRLLRSNHAVTAADERCLRKAYRKRHASVAQAWQAFVSSCDYASFQRTLQAVGCSWRNQGPPSQLPILELLEQLGKSDVLRRDEVECLEQLTLERDPQLYGAFQLYCRRQYSDAGRRELFTVMARLLERRMSSNNVSNSRGRFATLASARRVAQSARSLLAEHRTVSTRTAAASGGGLGGNEHGTRHSRTLSNGSNMAILLSSPATRGSTPSPRVSRGPIMRARSRSAYTRDSAAAAAAVMADSATSHSLSSPSAAPTHLRLDTDLDTIPHPQRPSSMRGSNTPQAWAALHSPVFRAATPPVRPLSSNSNSSAHSGASAPPFVSPTLQPLVLPRPQPSPNASGNSARSSARGRGPNDISVAAAASSGHAWHSSRRSRPHAQHTNNAAEQHQRHGMITKSSYNSYSSGDESADGHITRDCSGSNKKNKYERSLFNASQKQRVRDLFRLNKLLRGPRKK
jgi:hypothetical protein